LLIAGVASLVLFIGAVQFTNRSDFCTTCHYMQPFYDAWASSTHHDVPCRDCHYEPGYSNVIKGKIRDLNQLVKYWTNAYRRSKPWAEVSDESCLRSGCHSERLLHGRVMYDKVNFDHKPHLEQMRRGKKLRCTSCHSHIVQGEHMTVTTSTCVTCHFKLDEEGNNLAECTVCHDPPVVVEGVEPPKYDHTPVVEKGLACVRCHGKMVVGDGAVPRERCYACHWNRERLDQYDSTDVMHAKHITESKIECELCHLSMQHKSRPKRTCS
jgi:nitrate/TMAO reductase-like tetraheme cytochrome c subunit